MNKTCSPVALVGLLLSCSLAVTGCDYLEKKANDRLEKELEKELESDSGKKGGADDGPKSGASGSASASAADKAPADGTAWTDAGGATTKLVRVKIDAGGVSGLSMLAPEGAQVKPTLGGRGADVNDFAVGFAVWVLEDPSVTLPLMKGAASAKFGKESKVVHEDANSIIVGGKSPLGDEFFAYMGFFKANGKIYRCETEASQAGSTKAHAEAIDKACESLELDGKPIGSSAATAPDEKAADAADATKAEPEKVAASGGTKPAAATTPAQAPPPKTAAPAKTSTQTPPAQPTQAAPTPPKSSSKTSTVRPVIKRPIR